MIIIGHGGYARQLGAMSGYNIYFVEDEYIEKDCLPLSLLPKNSEVVIAIADSKIRERIAEYVDCRFTSYFHPSVFFYGTNNIIGEGAIAYPMTVIAINIVIGKHSQFDTGAVVGHDTIIGDYFTAGPYSFVAGDCLLGNHVYLGGGARVKQKTKICNNVTIGMGAVVVSDILEPGTYVGIPARKIKSPLNPFLNEDYINYLRSSEEG